jgi:hypothetical protein
VWPGFFGRATAGYFAVVELVDGRFWLRGVRR